MKLLLARHTETNYNILKLANADPSVDVHLSSLGIQQASNLAEALKDIPYDIVFVSELPRTRQTAEIINQFHDKEIVVDARLNDNKTGFEGKSVSDWLTALEASGDRLNARFADGESLAEASGRACEFIDYIKSLDHPCVLVVTHGFITQAIFAYVENKTLEESLQFNLVQGTYREFEI